MEQINNARKTRPRSQLARDSPKGSSWTLDHPAPVHSLLSRLVEVGQEAHWHSLQQDINAGETM